MRLLQIKNFLSLGKRSAIEPNEMKDSIGLFGFVPQV